MIKESDSCAAQDKALIRAKFARFVNPNRLDVWKAAGIDLIIGQREGYKFRDLSGAEYHDVHLNGGTFNLGHRHPEVVSAMLLATESLDVGNHHFAAQSRADLAERLSELCPGLQYSVFATGGSETNDIAIKASRWVTGRRKVVSLEQGYHGRTGISGAAGDDSSARYFNSDDPQNFIKVPFDDAEALARALADEDVACVILEPIPATCGFPIPSEGYFQAVRAACDATGTMLVADEIQTGLMRTGKMWAVEGFAVQPDILTTSKGLSGGMYPIGAAVLSASCGRWLEQSGWAHVNTFGGSEIGCEVALKALEIYSRPALQRMDPSRGNRPIPWPPTGP